MTNSKIIDRMIEIGGVECKNIHRIYFNSLEKLARLECFYNDNGHIISAKFDGEKIHDTSLGIELHHALENGDFWYDVKTESFGGILETRRWKVLELLKERIESQVN